MTYNCGFYDLQILQWKIMPYCAKKEFWIKIKKIECYFYTPCFGNYALVIWLKSYPEKQFCKIKPSFLKGPLKDIQYWVYMYVCISKQSYRPFNRLTRLRTGWRDYLMKRSIPGSHQKKSNKIGQSYICQRTKESFNLSIKGKLTWSQLFHGQILTDLKKSKSWCFV